MGRGYFRAYPDSLARIKGNPVARRLTETDLFVAWTSALLAPAADSFFQKVEPGSIRPPGLREIGALAAGAAIRRQIVKANVHRQRHAFSKRDRLLGSHARQRGQHSARRIRQRRFHEALIEVMPKAQGEDRAAL